MFPFVLRSGLALSSRGGGAGRREGTVWGIPFKEDRNGHGRLRRAGRRVRQREQGSSGKRNRIAATTRGAEQSRTRLTSARWAEVLMPAGSVGKTKATGRVSRNFAPRMGDGIAHDASARRGDGTASTPAAHVRAAREQGGGHVTNPSRTGGPSVGRTAESPSRMEIILQTPSVGH